MRHRHVSLGQTGDMCKTVTCVNERETHAHTQQQHACAVSRVVHEPPLSPTSVQKRRQALERHKCPERPRGARFALRLCERVVESPSPDIVVCHRLLDVAGAPFSRVSRHSRAADRSGQGSAHSRTVTHRKLQQMQCASMAGPSWLLEYQKSEQQRTLHELTDTRGGPTRNGFNASKPRPSSRHDQSTLRG